MGLKKRGGTPGSLSKQEGDADAVVPLSERGQFASAALTFQHSSARGGAEASKHSFLPLVRHYPSMLRSARNRRPQSISLA
jgi:hypothetical protein